MHVAGVIMREPAVRSDATTVVFSTLQKRPDFSPKDAGSGVGAGAGDSGKQPGIAMTSPLAIGLACGLSVLVAAATVALVLYRRSHGVHKREIARRKLGSDTYEGETPDDELDWKPSPVARLGTK